MEVKDAVRLAKDYVADLFEAEQITDVGLEEIEFDEKSDSWNVTIGFSRPWDQKGPLVAALGERRPARSYKVVRIHDGSHEVKSVTDRFLEPSQMHRTAMRSNGSD